MDEKILALISNGKERVRQEEEERAYEERQEQERIRALWDQFDNLLRPVLPEVLQPYMLPSGQNMEKEPDIDMYRAFHVEINIPDLAPFKVKLVLDEEQWKPVRIILPSQAWSDFENEPFLSFRKSWDQYPIEDLDLALNSAMGLQKWFVENHDRWELNNQARSKEQKYVPVDTEEDCLRLIKEQIRTIIRQEMKEAVNVGS